MIHIKMSLEYSGHWFNNETSYLPSSVPCKFPIVDDEFRTIFSYLIYTTC